MKMTATSGFIVTFWVTTLLVPRGGQVSAALTCFQCTAVSNITTCTSTVTCRDNELCYADKDSTGASEVHNLGCEDRTSCHIWESTWVDAVVGRRREVAASNSDEADDSNDVQQKWCNKCCDSNNCNHFLCSGGSGWLNKTCTSNGGCPARNTECFSGLCLCTPGYYYSHSGDSCVANCSEGRLGKEFLAYPRKEIAGLNDQALRPFSVEACKGACLARASCRSFDYLRSAQVCYTQSVGPLDVPAQWMDHASYDFYQRTCA